MNIEELFEILSVLKHGEEKEALKIKNQYVPDYLYKFYPGSKYAFDSLEKGQIWLSKPFYFNDPFEFNFIYVDKMTYENNKQSIEASKIRHLLKKNSTGVSCFAEDFDKLPMWAYYAREHKGFCVKYKVVNKDLIYPVTYIPFRVSHPMLDINNVKNQCNEIAYNLIFSIKNLSWEHEKEYRIIKSITENSNIDSKGDICFCKDIGLQIEGIIAGCRCSPTNLRKLKSIKQKISSNLHTEIFFKQAILSGEEYSLDLK